MRRLTLGLALLLSACSGGEPDPLGEARILSFEASPLAVSPGGTATLTWETSGTTGVNIEPRIGLQPASGSIPVTPFVTTTYVLSIPGGPQDLAAEVTVEVGGGAPKVTSFTATPRTIAVGEQATLDWVTTDADAVIIEPAIGRLDAPTGMFQVSPETTTSYKLTAVRGEQISEPAEVTVVVASGNQPFIKQFTASPQTITVGEQVTLSWEAQNADNVTIDNGVGVQATMGSVTVSPTETTTYNLTATGPGGQANASVTVNVLTGGDPAVVRFTATPNTVSAGGQVVLDWDTDNADGVNIDNGVGAQPAKGMAMVTPSQTTTYTLTAYANGKEATAQVTVNVANDGSPVVTTFEAQPAAILSGGSTTLTWATQNVTVVDISDVGAGLMPNGTVTVTPAQTTTYTLTGRGSGGQTVTESVTVEVSDAPPTVVSFNAQPASVTSGGSTTLTWTTQNATTVSIDNGVGSQPANGSTMVSPSQSTTYTLTAMGPGGQATAQVSVTVTQVGAPTINDFSAMPQQIASGAQATLSWNVTGATSVTIDNGVGNQAATGSANVSPAQTTTYTLTAVGAGGQTSAQTTVTVASVNGDTCADPFVISGSGTFTGNTNLATNDYSQSQSCTGYASTGPDVVYRVSLQAGDRLQASLQPSNQTTWDTAIYLVTSCGSIATSCVAGQDNGNPETIDYTAAAAGDFFLVVDGYGGQGGAYALDVTITAAPIANDTCNGAIDVTAGGTFSGDTTNASNDYSPLASGFGGCTGYTANSNDVVYRVVLQPGERLQASLDASWDASLYMITDCGNPAGTCAAGQDNGNPEQIDYTAQTLSGFFLIVDGYGSARGAYTLSVSVSPPVTGGDTCAAPVMVPAGGGSFQSTTMGAANDYAPGLACTGDTALGPDLVYALDLNAGDVVEALASFDATVDGSIYATTDCSMLTCVAGSDMGGGPGRPEDIRFVAQTTGTHYLIVDGTTASDVGGHDVTILSYGGDTCADAAPLASSGTVETAITTGLTNDYSPNAGGCTRPASGPERAYSVAITAGDQLDVRFTPNGSFDPILYVVSNCSDITGSCVVGTDLGANGGAERVAPVFDTSGTYYVMVDGYNGAAGSGSLVATVRGGDTCADAYVVPPNGGQFRGTTAGYAADYGTAQRGSASCTGYEQEGADAVYAIELDPGERVTATLTTPNWDAAVYLITDCASSATSCVAGSDSGNPETFTYTHSGASPATYYLVVDAWRTSDANTTREGPYALDISFN